MKKCFLCPRKCGAVRTVSSSDSDFSSSSSFCSSPCNPLVARAGLHHWEEPVISGSRGSGTVFFSGCNLKCVFCQNYDISTLGSGREITVERLREIYFELIAQGAHNINLVTPTHFADAVFESLTESLPVPVVWNSNGYDLKDTPQRFKDKVNIYLPDLKYSDNRLALRYSGVDDYFERATDAIKAMYSATGPYVVDSDGIMRSGVIVRHLILPGCVENTLRVIDWIDSNFKPGEIFFSLMRQYIPHGIVTGSNFPELSRCVDDDEYDIIEQALFDSSIEDGFVQDASSAKDDFIPLFDGSGV